MKPDEDIIQKSGQRKLTWKDFKVLVEASGVKENDEIDRIDISWGDLKDFECRHDDIFGWRIIL